MKTIIEYLKNQTTKAWQLRKISKESNEIYVVSQIPEAIRCNRVVDYSVLIHRNSSNNDFIAESRADFQILPKLWRSIINDTIERADYVQNPAYSLASPVSLSTISPKNPIYDATFDLDIQKKVQEIYETLIHLSQKQLLGCHLASFEIFLEKYLSTTVNSNGLNISIPSSKVILDFVLLSNDKQNEFNYYGKRRFLSHYNFEELIQSEAQKLNELEFSQLPPTGNYPVIMADEALDSLFDYFISQADGTALYYKYSSFKKNESIYLNNQTPKEALTIQSDPFFMGGMASGFVDDLGFPMKPLMVIEDGILKNFTINGKLSSLLKDDLTSAMSFVKIKEGVHSYESFIQNGVIELLRFSTFHPNTITGAFSGEIRFGYLHKDGKKIPLKGGSVSGVSQEAFLTAYFSKETEMRENYYGPKAVFFESLTLAGQ